MKRTLKPGTVCCRIVRPMLQRIRAAREVRLHPAQVCPYIRSLTLLELRTVDALCGRLAETQTLPRLLEKVSLLASLGTGPAEDTQQSAALQLAYRIEFLLDAARCRRWQPLTWLGDPRWDLELLLIEQWHLKALDWSEWKYGGKPSACGSSRR